MPWCPLPGNGMQGSIAMVTQSIFGVPGELWGGLCPHRSLCPPQMNRPIQVKPADSEGRGGRCSHPKGRGHPGVMGWQH